MQNPLSLVISVRDFLDLPTVSHDTVVKQLKANSRNMDDLDIIEQLVVHPLYILHSSLTYHALQDTAVSIAMPLAPRER
jgi:hypothetical protein